MAIFGSYLDAQNKRPLAKEAGQIIALDTFVAFAAGLIIFPICATFGVNVQSGPSLIFVSLPALFGQIAGGRLWGIFFFVFMSIAALTTVVAVFENIVAFLIDEAHMRRGLAAAVVGVAIALLSLPCALGFNVLSGFQPMGAGSGVLDLEDFIVSQNFLPMGVLLCVLFCTAACGWGWKGFAAEVEAGQRWKFGVVFRFYCRWILPLIVIAIFVLGYIDMFTDLLK